MMRMGQQMSEGELQETVHRVDILSASAKCVETGLAASLPRCSLGALLWRGHAATGLRFQSHSRPLVTLSDRTPGGLEERMRYVMDYA